MAGGWADRKPAGAEGLYYSKAHPYGPAPVRPQIIMISQCPKTVPLTWGPEVHSNCIFYVFLQIDNLELVFFSNFRELKSKHGK